MGKFVDRQLGEPGRAILPIRGFMQESEVKQFQHKVALRKKTGMAPQNVNLGEREVDVEVKPRWI